MQTPLQIAYNNLLDLSTAVVSSSSSPGGNFIATQVQSWFRALRSRTTGITSEWWKASIGVTGNTWNRVIFWDHNWTTSAVVSLYGSTDDVTYTATPLATAKPTVAGQLVMQTADYTYPYIKATVTDPTNPAAYLELGRMYVGDYIEAEYNYDYGFGTVVVSRSIRTEATNGVDHTMIRPQFQRIPLQFTLATPTMRDTFKTFVQAVDIASPFWVMLNVDSEIDTQTYYCTIDDGSSDLSAFLQPDFNAWNFGLTFREVT